MFVTGMPDISDIMTTKTAAIPDNGFINNMKNYNLGTTMIIYATIA